jgi:hypothetical protein
MRNDQIDSSFPAIHLADSPQADTPAELCRLGTRTCSNTELTAADLSRSNSNRGRRAGSYQLTRLCSKSIAKTEPGLVQTGFIGGSGE